MQYDELPKGKIKAALFDLDGTLLRSDKSIGPKTVKAVHKAVASGWYIAIATGRHPKSAQRYLEQMGVLTPKTLAVCFNGSALINVFDYKKNGSKDAGFATLHDDCADAQEIMRVAKEAKAFHLNLHAYAKSGLCTENTNIFSMREIFHSGVGFSDGYDFWHINARERFFKVIAVGEVADLDAFRASLSDYVKAHFEVMRTDDNFLEFIPHHCSKGNALYWLCENVGISPSCVVAFGDAENDLLMIKNAGLGIAMGNASAQIKSQADFVTYSNNDEGIAFVLDHLLA